MLTIHTLAVGKRQLGAAMWTGDHEQFVDPVPIEFATAGHLASLSQED